VTGPIISDPDPAEPLAGPPLDDVPAYAGGDAAGGLEAKLEDLAARPEARAGAAFAGGVLLAMIVRRLGR
jgi:hypothetical protein